MAWFKQDHNKALLGQLLVKQKLISQEQLARAIEHQRATGQRLGDIFAEWNLVTQQHVQEALRRQRHLRMAAAVVAALLAPLESYAAAALPAVAATAPLMQPLTEEELGATSAQGLNEELVQHVKQQINSNGVEVIGDLAKALNPVLGFLESDTSMKNVVYDPGKAAATIAKDGSLTLNLPTSIGEISFQNIRVRGSEGPSFGSISIKGIDLTGTVISLAFRH
ncbi:hypothetical protein ASC94_24765 [Massilia sp. Root418]|uniref:hypothetical protein n=1 Tax=Massilia sp. Root418 TaxID=1736532 RepID=UPI0006FFDD6B|nr:hypothetical protein [Massilia sp. Root418]KQW88617.1 hypothetical protein ASC94_24765 [Massilia sp. Root418]